MFKARDGYFKQIECPFQQRYEDCTILNCIFKHSGDEVGDETLSRKRPGLDEDEVAANTGTRLGSSKAATNSVINEVEAQAKDVAYIVPKGIHHLSIPRTARTVNARQLAQLMRLAGAPTPNKDSLRKEFEVASGSDTVEQYERGIRELLEPETLPGGMGDGEEDAQLIMPHPVLPSAPATIQQRKAMIEQLVKVLKQFDMECKTPVKTAMELEHRIAVSNTTNTYKQMVKKKVYEISHPKPRNGCKLRLTEDEYLSKLEELVIAKEKLARYGYITEIPQEEFPSEVRTCRRCGTNFKLAEQVVETSCNYHSGKKSRKDGFKKVFECCGGPVGDSEPCTESKHHVFHWSSPGEMHYAQPFKQLSQVAAHQLGAFKVIGIDCEMGYTTRGLELLRITAVDFFTGEEILDLLVQPKGQVIDLNTKWSGISEIKEEAVSFDDLIEAVGQILRPDTILVGHGLENDLNSLRLVHDRIIDTAILYPKHQTSPTFRFPLKYLTFKYLGRTIQLGEHDSMEDSLAAIDVVKYFINQDR